MNIFIKILNESWLLLEGASLYILFGILVAGLMRVFLHPNAVLRHLGTGRFTSVFKAALLGIPIPLCSCGVLPAAASLRKQGANKGATTAFMISTPESGVDSIALTYAMIDPLMTVARPVAAFSTAAAAGIAENALDYREKEGMRAPDLSCPVDHCCDGRECSPEEHRHHHTFYEKVKAGLRYSFGELWGDISVWFLSGILLAGLITVVVPPEIFSRHLGGGLSSMLIMLAAGIPLYICATASTPIAAALILQGVSPGAALVFLLTGPATNITSLTVLFGILGKRATAIYIGAIALISVIFGLLLDWAYGFFGISARAFVGQASEIFPQWLQILAAVLVLALSVKPLFLSLQGLVQRRVGRRQAPTSCGCSSPRSSEGPLPMVSPNGCHCGGDQCGTEA